MKWWPGEAKKGDMVRIKLGTVFHYGIFASDDEVIQFGEPPVNPKRDERQVKVISTDIDVFSAGQIVEVGVPEGKEKRQRLKPEETVRRARERIGEGGYNIIHNNCEHFANACYFGTASSAQEDEARIRYGKRELLDIYLWPIDDSLVPGSVLSSARRMDMMFIKNPKVRCERYAVWHLLEEAYRNTFYVDPASVSFKKQKNGKWTEKDRYFSLSHTDHMACAAVSNAPCGIDIEEKELRSARFDKDALSMFRLSLTSEEREELSPESLSKEERVDAFFTHWTRKESMYKYSNLQEFEPTAMAEKDYPVESFLYDGPVGITGAYTADTKENVRFFLYDGNKIREITGEIREGCS